MLQKFYLRTGAADLALCHAQLDALLETQPDKILIVLIGQGGTPPDAVLGYLALLNQTRTEVAISSLGNLLGADFALWLGASPLRDLRPSAWVFVPERYLLQPAEGSEATQVQTVEGMVHETAYQACLDLMAEHVDLPSILNRQVRPAELQELYLLDCAHLDSLPALDLGSPPPLPPSPEGPIRKGGLI